MAPFGGDDIAGLILRRDSQIGAFGVSRKLRDI
jgi:hypothetical protein